MYKVIIGAIIIIFLLVTLINYFKYKYDYYLPNIGGYWDYNPDYKYYYKTSMRDPVSRSACPRA